MSSDHGYLWSERLLTRACKVCASGSLAAVGGVLDVPCYCFPYFGAEMTRLAQFLIAHNVFLDAPWYRRFIHRAVFKPIESRDYGTGITGMYDLGTTISPQTADRFRAWYARGSR